MQIITYRCTKCRTHRDIDDLFNGNSTVCLLCQNRQASRKAQAERTSQRIKAGQRRAQVTREALSPAERYRRSLQKDSPYSDAEIERYVHMKFPGEYAA